MFTGIVSDIGTVIGNGQRNDVQRIAIACKFKPEDLVIGGSMACSGICLTVVSCDSGDDGDTVFEVDAAPETLEVSPGTDGSRQP